MEIADKKRDRDRAAGGVAGTCSAASVSRLLLAVFAAFVLADAVVTNLVTSWSLIALPRFSFPVREQASAAAATRRCHYGTQPYYFEALAGNFSELPESWRLHAHESECELRPMAEQLANGSDAGPFADRLVAILYGDSIDRTLVIGFCKLAGAEFMADPEPVTSRCYKSVTWCMTDKFLLMQSWTNGLHPSRSMLQAQPPEEAFEQSRAKLLELTGRTAPDLVVIASGMWDVTHWMHNKTWWRARPAAGGTSPYLGQERLRDYVADLKGYVAMVQDGFSGGVAPFMVTHTAPLRNPRSLLAAESMGERVTGQDALQLPTGHSRELQWNNYIATVNAALRHASRQMALPVIDYEPIAMQLPEAHLHVTDGLHPQGKLLATVFLNLLLNEYAAAAQQRSAANLPQYRWSRNSIMLAVT